MNAECYVTHFSRLFLLPFALATVRTSGKPDLDISAATKWHDGPAGETPATLPVRGRHVLARFRVRPAARANNFALIIAEICTRHPQVT